MNRPKSYWERRAEAVAALQHRKTDEYVRTKLRREYEVARRDIQREIESFYMRFAVNNEISLAEARKLLSSDELEDFKMSLEEFTRLAKNNPDGRWTQKLNNAAYKVRVSRLEALQIQIEAAIQRLNMSQNDQMTDLLKDTYTDTYYRTLYEIHKGIGMGTNFAKLDDKLVERIVRTPWLEQNYSQRIWGDNAKLVRQLETEITQAFIRGDGAKRTAEIIADRMGVGYRNAQRLVVTEMAHIQNEATFRSYRESGVVQKYELLAALDEKTCEICGPLDGKVFTLSEKQAGINLPPFHPRCRCDTVPYFDDEIDPGERIARDEEGNSYYVPGNMTFQEWRRRYVESSPGSDVGESVSRPIVESAKYEYDAWDKKNRKEFADRILSHSGLDLKAQVHKISAFGQCRIDSSGRTLKITTFELDSGDQRGLAYQVKTVFHELFHARAHGLRHDVKEMGFAEWAYYDDVFAEAFAHYMAREIGIKTEIAPSYANHLIETLPILKTLPEFKDAKTIADFGKIAYNYRFGNNKKATWGDLKEVAEIKKFDLAEYGKAYVEYMEENASDLIDKMLENMPQYSKYKSNMMADLRSAIRKGLTNLTSNETVVITNVLIIAMNRLGVNSL